MTLFTVKYKATALDGNYREYDADGERDVLAEDAVHAADIATEELRTGGFGHIIIDRVYEKETS